jgi:hypothetical protein
MNDLWSVSGGVWKWESGSSRCNATFNMTNPGSRKGAVSWKTFGSTASLFIFGGFGFQSESTAGSLLHY